MQLVHVKVIIVLEDNENEVLEGISTALNNRSEYKRH